MPETRPCRSSSALTASLEPLEPRVLLATNYYVSPTGSDSNSGTSSQSAWRTLGRVNQKAFQPGDQVLLQAGATFNGTLRFDANDNGASGKPVKVGTYGGSSGYKETGGRIDLQAEAFTGQVAGSGSAASHTWSAFSDSQAGGGTALRCLPNVGVSTLENRNGPRRDYAINFSNTGTYYVWVRLKGANNSDDSVHVGLNGSAVSLGKYGVGNGTNQWVWLNSIGNGKRLTMNVPSAGKHTFNLWMREDGVQVDGFVLTKDPNFKPSGPAGGPSTASSGGRATIKSGSSPAMIIHNADWFEVADLNLIGSGRTSNGATGLFAYNDLSGNVKLSHLYVKNVEVAGYGQMGIRIAGQRGGSGFKDVRVTDTTVRDNGRAGLDIDGVDLGANDGVYIGRVRAIGNAGISGYHTWSGSGIVIRRSRNVLLERSIATNNGFAGNGGVGIWAVGSDKVTIQFNEAYNNRTALNHDGGGFDLDGGVTNSVVQYNYSHGNHGAGYGLYQYVGAPAWSNNVIRYNISENDGRKNSYAGIQVWNGNGSNGLKGAQIYGNTIYMSPASSGTSSAVKFSGGSGSTNFHFRNNLFITKSGVRLISNHSGHSGLLFQGNNWWSSGSAFNIYWNGKSYSSLTAWRSGTGQEKLNGGSVGKNVDPKLVNAGGGGTIGNADNLSSLAAYKLRSDSPLINAGLNLSSLFGITPVRDFYGTSGLPKTGGYDIGAHEWVG